MNYYIFVLGYDLLHDALNGIDCDIAYDFCVNVYNRFEESIYNNPNFSGYECLAAYVRVHMAEIKLRLERLR